MSSLVQTMKSDGVLRDMGLERYYSLIKVFFCFRKKREINFTERRRCA